jgi:hypothetical protein
MRPCPTRRKRREQQSQADNHLVPMCVRCGVPAGNGGRSRTTWPRLYRRQRFLDMQRRSSLRSTGSRQGRNLALSAGEAVPPPRTRKRQGKPKFRFDRGQVVMVRDLLGGERSQKLRRYWIISEQRQTEEGWWIKESHMRPLTDREAGRAQKSR